MIFETYDPRGYKISCETSTWSLHVIQGHPVMADNIDTVKSVIEDPNLIFESKENPTRDVYFSLATDATYSNKFPFTRVVVEINEYTQSGEVVTAFPCKTIGDNVNKQDGGVKYDKSKL